MFLALMTELAAARDISSRFASQSQRKCNDGAEEGAKLVPMTLVGGRRQR